MEPVPEKTMTHYTGLRGFFRLLLRFVPLSFPYWDKLLGKVLIALCFNVFGVIGAVSIGKAVDSLSLPEAGTEFYFWMNFALGCAVMSAICFAVSASLTMYIKMRLELRLKNLIFNRIQEFSLRFHESRPIGENMYRVNVDTIDATDIAANFLPETTERIIGILTTASLVFVLNPLIALLVLVYIPIYYLTVHFIVTYAYRYQNLLRQRAQAVLALLQENLSAFVLSKAMSRERHELSRYYARLAQLARATISYGVADSFWNNGGEFIREWFMAIAYSLCCGYLVIAGQMSIGEYVATATILALVTGPIQQMVWMIQRLRISAVPARRMLQTIDLEPEVENRRGLKRLTAPRGEIVFDQVSFRYLPQGPDVLKDLSFRILPGEKVAIVGLSGAGKSSIFNLALRYYDPTSGRVMIDGMDLREVDLTSYRRHVGIVLQESFLYSATVRDNILFGDIRADDARFRSAVRLSGLEPLLEELPKGADTVLSEGGNLSAGQKQRIAIARAVIRDPQFLFLDEATSALDPATEIEILEQLRRVGTGRTSLTIAHSISSVQDADKILVMEKGVLVQEGTHQALSAADGYYQQMWEAEKEKRSRVSLTESSSGGIHD